MDKKLNNIYFYNTLCSEKLFLNLFNKHNVKSSNSAQKFFGLLALGLQKNSDVNVFVNTILPINNIEQKKILWKSSFQKENGISYYSLPYINLFMVNILFTSICVFFNIIFIKKNKNINQTILLDYLRYSINISALIACKLKGFKTITIATDLPGESVLETNLKTNIRNFLIKFTKFNFYVCITQDLNDKINKKNKPNLIIESFANSELSFYQNKLIEKYKERVIIYAGGLYEGYGIKNLIKGFSRLEQIDIQLWLYGTGPFVKQIELYQKTDSRIIYKGVLPNNELINELIKATLLVNPRPTIELFTKFSFPSKNMEYMSVGTPIITTKLSGIPKDHYPYIYTFENETEDGIYNTLNKILKKSNIEIHEFGRICKEYTLTNKNNISQAEKIIRMINKNN